MLKFYQELNLKSLIKDSRFLRISISCLITAILALAIFKIFPEITADINTAVKELTHPLIKEAEEILGRLGMIFVLCGGIDFLITKKSNKGGKDEITI